jgi:hypothetical protein
MSWRNPVRVQKKKKKKEKKNRKQKQETRKHKIEKPRSDDAELEVLSINYI